MREREREREERYERLEVRLDYDNTERQLVKGLDVMTVGRAKNLICHW